MYGVFSIEQTEDHNGSEKEDIVMWGVGITPLEATKEAKMFYSNYYSTPASSRFFLVPLNDEQYRYCTFNGHLDDDPLYQTLKVTEQIEIKLFQ